MTKDRDTSLVAECLNGNQEAFGELVKRYERQIFNVAMGVLRSHEDARDLTQTVFVKAYEKLDTFNPRYKFFSWIYRMTVNEAINYRNKYGHHPNTDYEVRQDDDSPEEAYHRRELAEELDEAIVRLPFDYRIVLVLRHFQDFSYREMAEVLHIPEKTVKSRLFTARQTLAELLSRETMGA